MFGELEICREFNTMVGRYIKLDFETAECIICPAFPEAVGRIVKFNQDFQVVPLSITYANDLDSD